MYYGVQYYPEHWPSERWEVDAKMMQRAGVNAVRMGEFAWSAMEPREGHYDFTWMDQALKVLDRHGIKTILCTCSRTPPPWVFRKYPALLNTRKEGKVNQAGKRYTIGHDHPEFRRLSQRIDGAVIRHFTRNPAVVGWQIDNEIGGGNDCYCERCLRAFQKYLRRKYGTVQALHDAWGRHFWSFAFSDFSEVPLPDTQPQLGLEYRRFLSGLNVEFARWRSDLIHKLDPGKPVTINFQNPGATHTDYWELRKCADISGSNYYPPRMSDYGIDLNRMGHDRLLVLEQCTRLAPHDIGEGRMRLWAWRAVAHGAAGIFFFCWRSCPWGQEQLADGLLPHSGKENRHYRELQKMGEEINRVGNLIDATVPVRETAIASSYESRWAVATNGGFQHEMNVAEEAIRYHTALMNANVACDGLDPRGDLSRYRLVVAPRLVVVDEAVAANLERFVRNGGVLCLTGGTGIADEFGKSFTEPRPGRLQELVGIEVDDMSSLNRPFTLMSRAIPGLKHAKASIMADEIHPGTASVVATYGDGWRKDLPAVTLNRYRKGRVVYVGTVLDPKGMHALTAWLLKLAGVKPVMTTPPGVAAYERRGPKDRLLFLLNNTEKKQVVTLSGAWRHAFTGKKVSGHVELRPVDLALLVEGRVT